ncbi:MAG: HIT family protein [Defluviitaleaceae bacterium]|nr:HIT family protein [Defluviitaleaceae bacterium]
MENCIFCKIIAREIPGHIVYEDEHVLAFLDISQTTEGHTLIIPKKHRVDVFEMDAPKMEQVFAVVPKIATALKKTFNCRGINMVNNNGEAAGQTVFHYHVHLIPRYEKDQFGMRFVNNMQDYDTEDLAALKVRIKTNL